MPNFNPPGNIKELFGTIRDADRVLYDPPVASFHVTSPAGVQTSYIYNADNEVTRIGAGVYKLTLIIPYLNANAGTWYYGLQAIDDSTNPDTSLGFGDDSFVIELTGTL